MLIEQGVQVRRIDLEQVELFLSEHIGGARLIGREGHPADHLSRTEVGDPLAAALDRRHTLVHKVHPIADVSPTQEVVADGDDTALREAGDERDLLIVESGEEFQAPEDGDVSRVGCVRTKGDSSLRR